MIITFTFLNLFIFYVELTVQLLLKLLFYYLITVYILQFTYTIELFIVNRFLNNNLYI